MLEGPLIIAGPCALENDNTNLKIADRLAELARQLEIRVIFKGSFDKANRSTHDALRGPGLTAGVAALRKINEETGLPVLTDIHEAWQAAEVAGVVDVIQIPALLCRQTDLLVAAGKTGKPVNIKKGQWMDAAAIAGAVAKVRSALTSEVAVTERGTFFGYGDLVVDMRSFQRITSAADAPVLFDVTHSIQQPGRGFGGRSGGDREAAPGLARAAVAAGARGLFIETHPDPSTAPSDPDSMWPLQRLAEILVPCLEIWAALGENGKGKGEG